jgi:hypothetical protein
MAVDVDRVDARIAAGYTRPAMQRAAYGGAVAVPSTTPALGVKPLGFLASAAIALGILLFNEQALEHLVAGTGLQLASENGPLENAQMLAMVPALALFWFTTKKSRGAVGMTAALLWFAGSIAFIREIDFKLMTGMFSSFDWLVAHGLQDGLFVILAGSTLLYLFRQRRYFFPMIRLALRWQAWPAAISLALLATAEFYLDGLTSPAGHFWEELVETNGYFLFALAAWKHAALIGDPDLDSTV